MIPEIGQRFGPYEILGRLGSGGMGLVFRAWDDRLHREVAIKLLHDDYKMPGMRERFLQEARAASALNHPNICTIFDIGEKDGSPYLVMELLQGETLRNRIARSALPAEDIVRYGQEIADALGAAHVKGIVHRDIKPANIFLVKLPSGKSQAKVLDFGLAKIGLSAGGGWGSRTLDLSMTGATVGTLAYMSPEQGRGEALDARSDLFSLGIVMYEMATRQVPFKGTTSAQVFVQLFNCAPEPVRNWNESIPRDLEKVIVKLLTKDRRERFQSAKDVQEALGRIAVKRSKGGWLNKNATPAVPLVRAPDPVARHKPPVRKLTGLQREFGADSFAEREPNPPSSDFGEHGFRPAVRAPARPWEGPERTQHAPKYGAVAESDSAPRKIAAARSMTEDAEVVRREQERVLLEARSQSGAHQLEYGLDDLDAYGFLEQESPDTSVAASPLEQRQREQRQTRITVAVAVLIATMGGIFLLARGGHFRSMVLGPRDGLLLTVVENKTGDKSLDGTVMQGLEIELRQSDTLRVLGGEAYLAGVNQIRAASGDASLAVPAQRVAEKVGAKAYLYGEILGSKAPYTISVDVLNANTNDKLTSLEETAEKREEIPAAIGRLAQAVRAEVGEGARRRARQNVPLEQEATGNVDALHAYWLGEAAMQSGRRGDALEAYQQAAALDPNFAQAQMRLAWLYRAEGAEVAAEKAGRLAQTGAAHAGDKVKLLAQLCYEINVMGDTGKARGTIRQYVARWPLDAEGLTALARVSRLRGFLPEALLAAQQSYGEDPFRAEAYDEAELAMIGMDRFDDALQLETLAQRYGVAPGKNSLAAAYLGGKTDVLTRQISLVQAAASNGSLGAAAGADVPIADYGLYLDNTGQLSESEVMWRGAADRRGSLPGLASARASIMAQAALDRALVESCSEALKMAGEVRAMERGPIASFHAAMAAALCGNKTYATKAIAELQQNFPHVTAVTQYYVPELAAAADIGVNEPASALQLLIGIGDYDQVSLAPYLRGLAHTEIGQMPAAIFDFQMVLAHRGTAFTLGSSSYPMAEIGVARAAAAGHNKTDSVAAYQRFLVLWADADKKDPLVKEALARSK